MMFVFYFVFIGALLFLVLRLSCGECVFGRSNTPDASGIPVVSLGWTLSLFLSITYLVCVGFDVLFPNFAMYSTWSGLLPGFVWLTPMGFVSGLIGSFLYGWYAALLFGGLYNAFINRRAST